jgi:hypothetical protein
VSAGLATLALWWGAGCAPGAASSGPGVVDPFRAVDPRAAALNADAKAPYRRGEWDEARRLYRQALAVDPNFLAPRLNIACSLVRQERFGEAAAEAKQLVESAYVPWAREIAEAADMGALKTRPEMGALRAALADSARRWARGLRDDLLFVARLHAPLRVPESGAGVFVLGPRQEIFAWSPASGRYRQLTTTDGRVLGILPARDRRHVLYVTAEKLVRGAGGGPSEALRGVTVRRLDLTSLSEAEPVVLAGDVVRVELRQGPGATFLLRIGGERSAGTFALRAAAGTLTPAAPWPGITRDAVVVTGAGTAGPGEVTLAGLCPLRARDLRPAEKGKPPVIEISPRGKKPFLLAPTLGAGISGLPLF